VTSPFDDPAEAFAVLGDETRLDILRTLADADEPLAFSSLRERAGVRDSGRFSYHLRTLCEYFVRETPEGYELGHAGTRVLDASGARSDGGADPDSDSLESDECPVCGEEDCGTLFHVHLTPPWRRE